ncbi:hypothetical protein TA3x_005659 [Tundrisphaera sp. TA3]|uniref:bestrophin-like domain n=1 Tax=Tundrisphaera sp. TA3 TaxID=3435775 RepID=UPI003EC136D3
MADGFFHDLPLGVLIPFLLVLLLVATEGGFRLGFRDKVRMSEPAKSQVGTIEAALLGLLGLLLGFTYSMASSRYDARKALVGAEITAVRSTLHRARLLPDEIAEPAEVLIHAYVRARIASAESPDEDRERVDAETRRLQERLWELADLDAGAPKRPEMSSLFVQGLNAMGEAKTRRDSALADHVPTSVLTLVFFATTIVFGVVGYAFGLAGERGLLATSLLALLIALVVLVVLDLDRPRRGLVKVGQQGMIRLRDGLDPSPPL